MIVFKFWSESPAMTRAIPRLLYSKIEFLKSGPR